MEPLRLNITDVIKLALELPEPLAALISGESVQATVLELLDDGRVVISVKGVLLKASSLVGPLRTGQVLQARVERSDGQILLKLDPLPGPVSGRQPNASDNRGTSVLDGSPRPGGLRQAAASEVRQGLQAPMDRIIVQTAGREKYDATLLREGSDPTGKAGSSAEKILTAPPPAKAGGDSFPLQAQRVSQGEEREDVSRPSGHAAPQQQAAQLQPSRQASKADPVAQLLRTLLPADESFVTSFQRLLKIVREAVMSHALPEQAGEKLEQLALKVLLDVAQADGPRIKEGLVAKGLQYERALLSSSVPETDGSGNPEALGPTLKGWLLETLKAHAKGMPDENAAAPGARAPSSESVPSDAQAPASAWEKEAQHMLKVIEREQVLNALNVQQGQPLMLEVPLNAGPVASLFLYVVQPDGKGAGKELRQSAKPYSLVTLLEFDGIGSIRVDALLTGKRLAARFMVEQQEVGQAMERLLPALRQGLTSKGYQVEGLSSTVADPALVRGEDLPVQTAAARNLLNLKI